MRSNRVSELNTERNKKKILEIKKLFKIKKFTNVPCRIQNGTNEKIQWNNVL